MIIVSGRLRCRDNAQWARGTPVTAGILSIAGNARLESQNAFPLPHGFAALAGITNAQPLSTVKSPDQLGVGAVRTPHTLRVVQLDETVALRFCRPPDFAFYPVQKRMSKRQG